jgi:rRNA-processing protein EBP2
MPSKSRDRDGGKKRAGKNAKFGFGGAKRYAKENTRESTSDLSSFSTKKMKSQGGSKGRVSQGGSKGRVGKKTRK